MARQYKVLAGVDYPASEQDLKKALDGKPCRMVHADAGDLIDEPSRGVLAALLENNAVKAVGAAPVVVKEVTD